MTVLCAGNCHVWLGSSSICTCEAARGPSGPTLALMFPGYNPYAPTRPPTPPTGLPLPDVPQSRLTAAERAGATHLSGDGLAAYTVRYGRVLQADWDGVRFCSWLDIGEEMPAGAAVLK